MPPRRIFIKHNDENKELICRHSRASGNPERPTGLPLSRERRILASIVGCGDISVATFRFLVGAVPTPTLLLKNTESTSRNLKLIHVIGQFLRRHVDEFFFYGFGYHGRGMLVQRLQYYSQKAGFRGDDEFLVGMIVAAFIE